MTCALSHIVEMLTSEEVTTLQAIVKLALSAILGGIVGFERKRKGQVAGGRTFALIAMGATLAMIVSAAITQIYSSSPNGDPARVAAQVISGIGFLGAGAIIKTKSSVRGVTTAAGIWVSAGIGLAVGIGMYSVALAAVVLILLTLTLLDYVEQHFNLSWESTVINMHLPVVIESIDEYRAYFHSQKIRLMEWYISHDYEKHTTVIDFVVQMRDNSDKAAIFKGLAAINPTTSITVQNEMKGN